MTSEQHTIAEEIAHAVTHGVGAVLSIAGLVVLLASVLRVGDTASVVAVSVYGATLVLLFLSSTLYHGIGHAPLKRFFLLIDHCAIYLLIAGTYTPFALIALPPAWGWPLFVAMWAMALAGIVFKVVAHCTVSIDRVDRVSLVFYLLMGWGGTVVLIELVDILPAGGLVWLAAGGLVYTAGIVFYVWERLPFNHAVWHLFVLAASACHYASVLLYVVPAA